MSDSLLLDIYRKSTITTSTYELVEYIVQQVSSLELILKYDSYISLISKKGVMQLTKQEYNDTITNFPHLFEFEEESVIIALSRTEYSDDFCLDIAQIIAKKSECEDLQVQKVTESIIRINGILYHDVRNTLGGINGVVQLIELEIEANEEIEDHCNEILSIVTNFDNNTKKQMSFLRENICRYSMSTFSVGEMLEKR